MTNFLTSWRTFWRHDVFLTSWQTFWHWDVFLTYWMFYDHLSAHSFLAKLGRWGWCQMTRMRLAWKKSQKTLDTYKRLHQNKTWSTGSVDKGTWSQLLPLLGLRTRKSAGASSLSDLPGCEMSWPGGVYNRVLNCGSTQTQGLLYTMIEFFNHGIQGKTTWSQCGANVEPTLSFCPDKPLKNEMKWVWL